MMNVSHKTRSTFVKKSTRVLFLVLVAQVMLSIPSGSVFGQDWGTSDRISKIWYESQIKKAEMELEHAIQKIGRDQDIRYGRSSIPYGSGPLSIHQREEIMRDAYEARIHSPRLYTTPFVAPPRVYTTPYPTYYNPHSYRRLY